MNRLGQEVQRLRRLAVALAIVACSKHSSGGPPDGQQPMTTDDIVVACVVANACGAQILAGTANECINSFTRGEGELTAAAVSCLVAAAADCNSARACTGLSPETPVSSCPSTTSCSNGQLVQCVFNSQYSIDCTKGVGAVAGETCLVDNNGQPGCALGTCAGGADACNGTIREMCGGHVLTPFDCGAFGEVCQLNSGFAECTGTGAPCTQARVESDAVDFCVKGHEHHVVCADAVPNGSVQTGSAGPYCGLGTVCATDFETCTSTTSLSLCAFGTSLTFDCRSLGFTACDNSAGARCR